MSHQRFTALIQIFVLTFSAVVLIAQPVRSHTGNQYPDDIGETLQVSFLHFIFPDRSERTRGSRKSARPIVNISIPYVLNPRNTALISTDALTLQWQPVEGATSYTVEIKGRDVDWAVEVDGTEVTFNEVEALAPSYRYTIVVTTDGGISSTSGESVGFSLLPENERDRINVQVDAIRAAQLGPDEEALAIALEYFNFQHSDPDWDSYAVNQAVIDVLESRIQAGTQDSRVYLLQADTYLRVGLSLLAQQRYAEALTYAQAAGLQELQAESHWGLGDVAQGRTEYEDALAHLQMAQNLYRDLGDFEQAEELQAQVEAVETQLP